MKYRGASQLMLGGMAMVLLTAPGCSNMKWFQSGSEEASNSESSLSASSGAAGGYGPGEGGRDGQYPSLGRQQDMASQDMASEAEGGRLRGFSPLVNGQIAGEERLSRSPIGNMLTSADMDAKWAAEIRREEAAAMEAGLKDVFYGYDRYNVSDNDGVASLTGNAVWLKENPKALLKISGHCDERGTHDYNLVLGEKRAKAAKSFLVDMGVNAKQVAIISYGKDRPFCADHDEVCHQQNRRGHMLLRK
ncbi:MAG: OmpA family protein [Nitrospira sp.]|jgi:peptidoglycan-associated lipoprotein|nr:OmpA family protein [Nitrospira sp.]MBS0176822.1 OmpA family protein [Nitrospira sp.]MBS0179547.1 OmpA family protein [Nitrospira sp.]MBX3336771.1 OmpA family protein [Nitrospira sp.]MCW5778353.1 OmpA family protein [Nitrospira sp.]